MDNYVSTKQASKILNVSSSSLRFWDSKGKIDTIRSQEITDVIMSKNI